MMTQDETLDAWNADVQLFEDIAREQYTPDDYLDVNKIFTFTIDLNESKALIWWWGRCAKDAAILQDNLEKINIHFTLDGDDVALDQFVKL